MQYSTAQPFDPSQWREVEGFDFTDITYHRHVSDTLSLIHISEPTRRS